MRQQAAQRRSPRPPREPRPLPEGAVTTPPPGFVDTIPVGEAVAEAGDGEREGRRRRRRGGRGGRRDDAGADTAFVPNEGREAAAWRRSSRIDATGNDRKRRAKPPPAMPLQHRA